MTASILRQSLTAALLLLLIPSIAQETRTFNQNASRSNHTRLSLYLSPVYSTPVNNKNDSLLFRGSGGGIRFGADYFFGKVSIGITSGFGNSSADNTVINNFLKRSSIPPDQLVLTKTKQQNMYILLGPSVQFGKAVQLYAHAKAGLFINNAGSVTIQQRGAQRASYRNEATGKNVYPGFLTGLNLQYAIKPGAWSIGFGADYMNTKAEVNNFDARRGGGVEGLKLSRNISDVVAGITIRYTISSPRDAASGMPTGKRMSSPRDAASGRPTGRRSSTANDPDEMEGVVAPRDAASGRPTGRRSHIVSPRDPASGLPTGKRMTSPRDVASGMPTGKRMSSPRDAASGLATGRRSLSADDPNCGTVTRKVTNPDGTSEEMTFSCPADAAAYHEWKNGDINSPMESRHYQAISNASKARGSIAGTLTWSSSGTSVGIVTNRSGPTRSGSTTLNSQTSSTRTTNQSSFGTLVRMSARENGSGIATGKRDAASGRPSGRRERGSGIATGREAGSGMASGKRERGSGIATGRRQYEPMFSDGQGDICNPCIASFKSNPLYKGNSLSVNNALYKGNERKLVDADENCDGVAEMDVYLIDVNSGTTIARTKTERCGDFFFTNVPEGDYIVRVSGYFLSKKGYDVSIQSKADLLGMIADAEDWMELVLESGSNENMTQKAGVSTSRSNIRTKHANIPVVLDDGIEVSLAKNPTDQPLQTVWIDENSEFEFTDVEAGNYFMSFDQGIYIEDETVVTVGAPENIVTSESNLEDRKASAKQGGIPVKWSAPESYKSILIEADLDGDGEYESNVTNQVSDEFTTNDKGEMQQKAGISTSRSNIRTKSGMQQISNDLYTCTATATLNNKDVPVRIVYKTKHDTAKNSVQNIR
jgi:hypothetical protein